MARRETYIEDTEVMSSIFYFSGFSNVSDWPFLQVQPDSSVSITKNAKQAHKLQTNKSMQVFTSKSVDCPA